MKHLEGRVMVLGAGPHQVPVIKAAVELGFHVTTVDYIPSNVGHRFSHASLDISTVDAEAVLEAARHLEPDGVLTVGSDLAVPTVAVVTGALGTPGPSVEVAELLCDKGAFRAFQHGNGLPAPGFAVARSMAEVRARVRELRPPIVVKPVDASGSKGISSPGGMDDGVLEIAFRMAASQSRVGRVCIEELVAGTDVSGDGFMSDGLLTMWAVTRKHSDGFRVLGHEAPSSLTVEDQRRVALAVQRCLRAAGYNDGPVDFDARVGREDVTIIELSPRLGGNGIPELLSYAHGIDLCSAAVRWATGRTVDPDEHHPPRPSGTMSISRGSEDRAHPCADEEDLRREVPSLLSLHVAPSTEDAAAHLDASSSLACAVFRIPRGSTYADVSARIEASFRDQAGQQEGTPT